jgi:hypothetical protein
MNDNNTANQANSDKSKDAGQEEKKEGFLDRGKKGHDSHNMGNDISGDLKIANSNGEMEGGEDKTWHINEGK